MTTFQKIFLLIIVLFSSIWFYWTQIRPANIRSECAAIAPECAAHLRDTEASAGDIDAQQQQKKSTISRRDREACYDRCLSEKGLK